MLVESSSQGSKSPAKAVIGFKRCDHPGNCRRNSTPVRSPALVEATTSLTGSATIAPSTNGAARGRNPHARGLTGNLSRSISCEPPIYREQPGTISTALWPTCREVQRTGTPTGKQTRQSRMSRISTPVTALGGESDQPTGIGPRKTHVVTRVTSGSCFRWPAGKERPAREATDLSKRQAEPNAGKEGRQPMVWGSRRGLGCRRCGECDPEPQSVLGCPQFCGGAVCPIFRPLRERANRNSLEELKLDTPTLPLS